MTNNRISRPRRRTYERQDPSRLRLWPIGWALAACFLAAAVGLAGLSWLALALLHHPQLPRASPISLHDLVEVLQLVFASVAGAGALVALVMAYRRQRVAETATAHDRTRVLNERFTAIASQLGDQNSAIRLAGVHAMAGLADDWPENRQTCVDVLCAYLRMPYEPEPAEDAVAADRLAFRGNREVRQSAIRVITARLLPGAKVSWQGLDFDFTGVVFDGGFSFDDAVFSGGSVSFGDSVFSGGIVSFNRAVFSGSRVSFGHAVFSGSRVSFLDAVFSGGMVNFYNAGFSGGTVSFNRAVFSGSRVSFGEAVFSGGTVSFLNAAISGGSLGFFNAGFSGGTLGFDGAAFYAGNVSFGAAVFSGSRVSFAAAFSGSSVSFVAAVFSGGTVSFAGAGFSGGTVSFDGGAFSGGTADFGGVKDWSHPPRFGADGVSPGGVVPPAAGTRDSP
jgi:hypothetical protein